MSIGIAKSRTNRGRRKQKKFKEIPLSNSSIENKGFRNKMKERILNKLKNKKE